MQFASCGGIVRNWVWSTTHENWPTVKEKNAWSVNSPQKKSLVAKGDKMAFYVKSSRYFQGVFEATSDWHGPTVDWPDASIDDTFEHEIDLKPIQLGYADLKKLAGKLEFIENKKHVGVYLRGSSNGPANLGRPISDSDLQLILDELQTAAETPPARSGDHTAETFIPVESWDFIKERVHRLPAPELTSVKCIIDDVTAGKLAIPNFQREFAWKRPQMVALWESIFQGFFVGSILTWTARDQLATNPVHGAPKPQDEADIVLDGQQRITSLYYAVSSPEAPLKDHRPMRFFVDLKALLDPRPNSSDIVFSEFTESGKDLCQNEDAQFAKKAFPLEKLNSSDRVMWLTSFKEYLKETEGFNEEQARGYFKQILDILEHVWSGYEIPVVRLPKSLTLDSVAGIFERINSKGTKLGVFDLLNSRFMKYGVSLREYWDKTKADFDSIAYVSEGADNAEKYILQGLALFKKGSARRKEMLTLDRSYTELREFQKEDFARDWSKISEHTSGAIKQMKSQKPHGFGATKFSMIPYTVLIPLISSLMYKIEGLGNEMKCMDKIRAWYWSTVVSDNYSGSIDTRMEKDYQQLLRWFGDDQAVPSIVSEQRLGIDELDVDAQERSNSVYKAVMCLVLKEGARDFSTGQELEAGALDDCRIFPKSGKRGHDSDVSFDSILNKTVLSHGTGRKFLKGRMPSEYIKKIMEEQNVTESTMRGVLKTHLISDDAFDCMLRDDFAGFVNARRDAVCETLKSLILPADIRAKPDIVSLLRRDETHTLEYKSSLRWNMRENRKDASLEEVVIKELCCFMNSEGGDLLIGVNDDGEPIGLAGDYGTFRDPSADQFGKHMINLVNKYLHKPANAYVKLEFVKIGNLDVCWCKVKPSPKPIFLHKNDDAQFFARANNTCQSMNTKQATEYIAQHWG